MAAKKVPGRLIYAATVVAILGMTGGFVLASVVTVTTTNQTSTTDQVNGANSVLISSGTAGSLAVAPGNVPAAVASCSSGATALTSGGATSAYVSSTTGSTACSTGNFAEVYTIVTGSTAPAGTYQVEITTQWGSGPTIGDNTLTFTIASALTSAATITLYVDYGSPMTPTGGISTLQIVITP
ncbi:MAG TPA: hypothetical protein VGP88_00760 [Thermoplasmata archaeon]|jgi:hypothetical protein|nr:hypothetical protein [Thermoplasmata archaeon]